MVTRCENIPRRPESTFRSNGSELTFTDLNSFERDVLLVIRRMEVYDESVPYGSTVADAVDALYGESVNRARLYTTVDRLVERGLVEKSVLDARRNGLALTEEAVTLLEMQVHRLRYGCGMRRLIPADGNETATADGETGQQSRTEGER